MSIPNKTYNPSPQKDKGVKEQDTGEKQNH